MSSNVTKHVFETLSTEFAQVRKDKQLNKGDLILERLFPAQRAFVKDPTLQKALLCPRRVGKSYTAAAYLVHTGLMRPGSNLLYLAKTRGMARSILWTQPDTGLKKIDEDFELGLRFHNTFLQAFFPSGSMITLSGADSQNEIDKHRGQAYDLVIIDECKNFPHRLITELIEQVVGPALSDRLGTLAIMGTPGAILAGAFYDATKKDSPISRPYKDKNKVKWRKKPFTWSYHSWTAKQNLAMPHLWGAFKAKKIQYGWSDENPIWRREYLGEWIADDTALVYKFDREKNIYEPQDDGPDTPHGLPAGHQWHYILGIDLGYDDDFALEVAAYSETSKEMYQVYEYISPNLIIPDIAKEIRIAQEKFGEFETMVGDRGGLGKTVLETLSQQYELHIEPADKQEKRDYIELLNADLIDGRIKLREHGKLAEEMTFLQWDESGTKEDKSCDNHACDAFLYLWRHSYHHYSREPEEEIKVGSPKWYENQELEAEKRAMERREAKNRLDYFDEMFQESNLDDVSVDQEEWV